jgi:TolA-binding protein
MRFHLFAAAALASAAIPAFAQDDRNDRRVEKLEQEVRALQRRVFQTGATVQPEIAPSTAAPGTTGVPATSAVADLSARVDALEGQLRSLTGQIEENGNRLRQLEESLVRFQAQYHREAAERAAAATPPPAEPVTTPARTTRPAETTSEPTTTSTPSTSAGDAAEAAYNAGYRLWEQKRYAEAQQALEAMAKRYPTSKWASWANNLAGRAYLDEGKPATAAKTFLANYQGNPRGERAADSLFFLGQALQQLGKSAEACKAYDELQAEYGSSMRAFLREQLPSARRASRCGS